MKKNFNNHQPSCTPVCRCRSFTVSQGQRERKGTRSWETSGGPHGDRGQRALATCTSKAQAGQGWALTPPNSSGAQPRSPPGAAAALHRPPPARPAGAVPLPGQLSGALSLLECSAGSDMNQHHCKVPLPHINMTPQKPTSKLFAAALTVLNNLKYILRSSSVERILNIHI